MTNSALRERVTAALDGPMRPSLEALGVEMTIINVEPDGVVQARLGGACPSCPSTTMSLIMGLEQQLRDVVPEVAYLEVTT